MSEKADGGYLSTEPHVANGEFINRNEQLLQRVRLLAGRGDRRSACPFTTLYQDFLVRHGPMLEENRRMGFQVKNLERKSDHELKRIRERAEQVLGGLEAH